MKPSEKLAEIKRTAESCRGYAWFAYGDMSWLIERVEFLEKENKKLASQLSKALDDGSGCEREIK